MGAAEVYELNGAVTDDARVAGQMVILGSDAAVADDMLVAAHTLDSRDGSLIGGELRFASAQALLGGNVETSVWGAASAVRLSGDIGGDVTLDFGDTRADSVIPVMPSFGTSGTTYQFLIPLGLTVDDSAQISGELRYTSLIEARSGADVAPVRTTPATVTAAAPVPPYVTAAFDYARRVGTLLLVGALLLLARAGWVRRSAESVRSRYLHNAGWGLVAFFGFFVVALMLLVGTIALTSFAGWLTLGGLAAAIFGTGALADVSFILAFVLVVNYIAQVVVSVMAGRWILERIYPAWAEQPWAHLLVGVLLLAFLEAIPFLGFWVGLVVVMPVLGVLWDGARARLRRSEERRVKSEEVGTPAAGAPMAA
jgi:hypothetical protein